MRIIALFAVGLWITFGLFACWYQNTYRGRKKGVKYMVAVEDIFMYAAMGPIGLDLFREAKHDPEDME